jgi:hypothetical protein
MVRSFPGRATEVREIARNRSYDRWIARGIGDETYALLQSLVHDDITDASAAALIWYFRNVLFFEQAFDQDDRVKLLSYERLVLEPEQTMERTCRAIGISPSRRLTTNVFSNSVRKRRDPDIEPAIREVCDDLSRRLQSVMAASTPAITRPISSEC